MIVRTTSDTAALWILFYKTMSWKNGYRFHYWDGSGKKGGEIHIADAPISQPPGIKKLSKCYALSGS